MPFENSGVMVAPNCCRIKAKILQVEQSAQYPDKWLLGLEILASQPISGPNFAHVGEKVEGFMFGESWPHSPPVIVEADAEYIGGPHRGVFQLSNVQIQPYTI